MKEYVEESMEVGKEEFFGEAYDHEKANMEQSYLYGVENTKKEMIKSLYENGITDINILADSSKLSLEEVQKILKEN